MAWTGLLRSSIWCGTRTAHRRPFKLAPPICSVHRRPVRSSPSSSASSEMQLRNHEAFSRPRSSSARACGGLRDSVYFRSRRRLTGRCGTRFAGHRLHTDCSCRLLGTKIFQMTPYSMGTTSGWCSQRMVRSCGSPRRCPHSKAQAPALTPFAAPQRLASFAAPLHVHSWPPLTN